MSGLGGTIDANIIKKSGVYHALVSKQPEGRMLHYTAPALTGPYSLLTESSLNGDNFLNFEGPAVAHLKNGGYRVYIDQHRMTDTLYYTDTFDLLTWTPPSPVSLPMRHIGILETRNLASLREYPWLKENVSAMRGDKAPYWGVRRNPSDINREYIETITLTMSASGWAQLVRPQDIGFTGVDYISAQPIHDENQDVCAIRPQIAVDNIIAFSARSFSGEPMVGKTVRFGIRIVGWGPIGKR